MVKMVINPDQNIVLIGFMGCGKTSVGKRLAKRLVYEFADSDDEIAKRAGMSIPHIFAKYGEAFFRGMEREAIEVLSGRRGLVIATGGGAATNPINIEKLKSGGCIFYLCASPEQLHRNTLTDQNRPLLQTGDRLATIRELLAKRDPLYRAAADYIIRTDGLDTDKVTDVIIRCISAGQGK